MAGRTISPTTTTPRGTCPSTYATGGRAGSTCSMCSKGRRGPLRTWWSCIARDPRAPAAGHRPPFGVASMAGSITIARLGEEVSLADSSSLPRALVTGAAGFIWSHVVRALLAQGRVEVVALDDLSGGFCRNILAGVEFVEASITDHAQLARLFQRHRFRYVYHLAAYAAEGLSHFIRRFNYTNNVLGSINLINEAVRHEVECFVFTSSIAVYGAVTPPMREDQRPCPEDPYGVAKLAVELDLAAARHIFMLPHVIFRPHNVYGEFQNLGDPYRNVIGIFMNQIMQGRPMTVFGDGTQRRAFSYVGDIAPIQA